MAYAFTKLALVVLALAPFSAASIELPSATKGHVQQMTVRVLVDHKTDDRRASAGFVWPDNSHVVTSYHSVIGGDEIQIVYLDGNRRTVRNARIVKSLHVADLVLLQVNSPIPRVPARLSGKITRGEDLWVLGFPDSSPQSLSRDVKLRDIAPPNLRGTLSPSALTAVEALGFPSLDAPIVQLESDLVPGDSGAPIFNSQGEVVAIGMGGLRSGTIGVSWAVDSLKLHDLKVEDNAALVAKARTVVKTMFSYRESDAPDGSPTLPRSYQTSFELSGQNALGPFIPTEPFYSRCSPLSSRFTKWGRSEFAHSGRFSINLIPEGNPETGYARTNGCSSPTQTISAAELSSPLNTSGMDIVAISYFELSRSNPRTKDVHNCDSSLNVYYALDQGDWKLYSAMCGSHRSENHTWTERRLLIPTSGASSMRLAFTYTLQNSSHPDPEAAYFIDDFQMEARRLVDETATY